MLRNESNASCGGGGTGGPPPSTVGKFPLVSIFCLAVKEKHLHGKEKSSPPRRLTGISLKGSALCIALGVNCTRLTDVG